MKRKKKKKKKKKKRKKRRSSKPRYGTLNFVWKPTLIMDSMRFGMDLWVCMMIILLKPRVLLGFHLNPKIMESKVEKNLR